MKHILDLTLMPSEEGAWYDSFSTFRAIARRRRIDVRWLTCEPGDLPVDRIHQEIGSASAFLLRIPSLIARPNEFLDMVRQRMSVGVPLICFLDRNYYEAQNDFLREFGMQGSMIGLFAKHGDMEAEHARDLKLVRESQPSAFREPRLFAGVQSLSMDSTQAMRLQGEAQSLLALPSEFAFSVDTKTDLPENNWPVPEFTCIGAYFGRNDDRRKVIAISTALLGNKFEDGFGATHPGIEGGDNRVFAENLLSFVCDSSPQPALSNSSSAHRLIEQIERNYYDFTRQSLQKQSGDWWSLVPQDVCARCAGKKQHEPDSVFPESAYMDLLDYRKIWKSHWDLFHASLKDCGLEGGKSRALKYFHELNEIRKLVSHPTKIHSIGADLVTDQMKLLEQEAARSVAMWRHVSALLPV